MDFLECGICHIGYNENDRRPRNSPCGHEFCSICLKALISNGEYVCPKCREKTNVNAIEDLPLSFGLIDVIRAFKANAISMSKEADKRVPSPSNEDVCNIHYEPISDWCVKCQLWLCTSCLDSHPSLIGCSTTSSLNAMDKLKDNQNTTVDNLLMKFDEDTSYVSSKIQEHSDKRKEYLEIAEKHEAEMKKLQKVLFEGNNYKEKLVVSKKHLNETKTPHAVIESIKLVTQRKQTLLSWSAKNIERDITSKSTQMLLLDNKVQNSTPKESDLVFLDLAINHKVKGRVFIELFQNLPTYYKTVRPLFTGEKGPTLKGLKCSDGSGPCFLRIVVSSISKSVNRNEMDTNAAKISEEGSILAYWALIPNKIHRFYISTSKDGEGIPAESEVFGKVVSGLDIVRICKNHDCQNNVTVVNCGLVSKEYTT